MKPQLLGFAIAASAAACFGGAAAAQDVVNGTLVQFNENGAWSWFEDERAIVADGKVLVSSIGDAAGTGGVARNGNVDLVTFDLSTRRASRFLLSDIQADDHNTAALLVRPDGRYLAVYSNHGSDALMRYRVSTNPADSLSWQAEQTFNNGVGTTYSNVFHLSGEGKTYNFTRTHGYDPNFLVSSDQGSTWSYGGYLLRDPADSDSTRPYLKYASNGTDKVHFITTQGHPRNVNNGIYAGYYQGGNTYTTDGTLIGPVGDNASVSAPSVTAFGTVIAPNTVVGGTSRTHFWTTDLALDSGGNPYAAFTSRVDGNSNDHRFYYARWTGAAWNVSELARAGGFLYQAENDYTGLVALDPSDPDTVYISTNVHPQTNAPLAHYEIFKGQTGNSGTSWNWTAVTEDSTVDNLRPILTERDGGAQALMWMRGTYTTYTQYDLSIVGLVDTPGANPAAAVNYVDATMTNTSRAAGTGAWSTGPTGEMGATDGLWHRRSGFGNGNEVLASDEAASEDAPLLNTTTPVEAGLYDVYAYFWGDKDEDWQLLAGLSPSALMVFDKSSAQHVDLATLVGATAAEANAGDLLLYRAYLGRTEHAAGENLQVFIDDGIGSLATRTWYDGIGYAAVPEPTSTTLTLGGAMLLLNFRRRR